MINTKDVHKFMVACGHVPAESPIPETKLSQLYLNLITEEVCEFSDSETDDKKLDACFDIIWVIIGYCKARGWDLDAAWREGAGSNLAKIGPAGQVIRREDGKILKPEGWVPPDFTKFVQNKEEV
jgi:hypothetical protein